VIADDGVVRRAKVGSGNTARFDRAVRTSSLIVSFPGIRPEGSYDPYAGRTDLLPVGASELIPLGAQDLVRPEDGAEQLKAPCGTGPVIEIDGRSLATAVGGTRSSIMNLQPQRFSTCGSATVSLGDEARISAWPSPTWRAAQVRLDASPAQTALGRDLRATPVTVFADTPDSRTLGLPDRSSPQLLSVLENANSGWEARSSDGTQLEAVTVGGWHQGWIVPAGVAETVTLTYVPQRTYSIALVVGLGLALCLLVSALVPVRRPAPPVGVGSGNRIDRLVFIAALTWLAGLVGLGVGLLSVGAGTSRVGSKLRPTLSAVFFVVGGFAFVLRPWSSLDGYAGGLAWPQALALVAAALALAPLSTDKMSKSLGGTLDDDPAQPSGEQAGGQSHGENLDEVAGERNQARDPENDVEQQDVPQEKAVRDASEEEHGP
jgi:arabinofuranan 3-O-arabinosyltransferase